MMSEISVLVVFTMSIDAVVVMAVGREVPLVLPSLADKVGFTSRHMQT